MKEDIRSMPERFSKIPPAAVIAINMIFLLFLMTIIEITSRLIYRETHLDNILSVLEQDPKLIWKNRPGIDKIFMGRQICTDSAGFRAANSEAEVPRTKSASEYRIFCLGASPTFGWGVDYEETYPYRLQEILAGAMKNKVRVINAGMVGYSSWQGKHLLEKVILSYNPDMLVVSYVINDVDRYRFFRSNGQADKKLAPAKPCVVMTSNILARSGFIKLLRSTLLGLREDNILFHGAKFEDYKPADIRVPAEDYRENLRKIADLAAANNIKLVFLKMPVNLPVPEYITEERRSAAKTALDKGLTAFKDNALNDAAAFLEKSLKSDPYSAGAAYYLAITYKRMDRPALAKDIITRMHEIEGFRCGAYALAYNKIMEEVAAEKNIPLSDIANAFHDQDEYLFLDRDGDTIHPNPKGHRIISENLYDTITSQGRHVLEKQ